MKRRRILATVIAGLLAAAAGGVSETASAAPPAPAASPASAVPASGAAGCPAPAAGLTFPDPPDHGVAQAQVFDRSVTDPTAYAGHVYFVWGSLVAQQPAGVVGSSYATGFRNAPQRTYTYDWFLANHPSWIEYTADRTTPAWEFGNHVYTPLDMGNPEVRQWYFTTIVDPAIAAGYRVIAVDNIGLRNDFGMSGHYDDSGTWVQQFSADPDDATFFGYVNDWLSALSRGLHARGAAGAFNITFNASLHDASQDKTAAWLAATRKAIATSDIWLNEQGFTVHRTENVTDDEWLMMYDLIREFRCKSMVIDNKLPTDTWDQASGEQRQWVVANYLLYREQPTMMVMTGLKDYAQYNDIPELDVDLGKPVTGPIGHGTGLWLRRYQQGLTVVNPSSTVTRHLRLPGTWADLHGVRYSGRISVPPNTGLVLSPVR
ncbi:putative glycoside hydrolase [Streptomyces sp. NBC_00669]|uniref:putative glycoside hydrolase n=1 Tax=Streptomyces sp. NBC_00669 TaxID=2976011 RepID=UPI002E31AD8E|nr:putative glycoside hydrolase [Streptomyces sp. NBC_00669]